VSQDYNSFTLAPRYPFSETGTLRLSIWDKGQSPNLQPPAPADDVS